MLSIIYSDRHNFSIEAAVIYEEPKSALPQPALDRMQQCPAYRITGQCASRRSQNLIQNLRD